MKRKPSKVAHNWPPIRQPVQNQPKSHFLFHKNVSLPNFYIMTLLQTKGPKRYVFLVKFAWSSWLPALQCTKLRSSKISSGECLFLVNYEFWTKKMPSLCACVLCSAYLLTLTRIWLLFLDVCTSSVLLQKLCCEVTNGQLISEWLFDILSFPKNQCKNLP